MHEVAKRSAALAAATGGLLLAGAACASADAMAHVGSTEGASARAAAVPGLNSADVLSGNSVEIPVNVPLNVCGIGALGMSADGATCTSNSAAGTGGTTAAATATSAGVLSGNTVQAPLNIPVNLCGIGALGMSADSTSCGTTGGTSTGGTTAAASTTSAALASGNTVQVPLNVPVNLCGVGALGTSADSASCGTTSAAATSGAGAVSTAASTSAALASGNTVQVPLNVPVNLCGVGALGTSADSASCGTTSAAATSGTGATSTSAALASGNTVQVPLNVPVNLCGVGALGMSADGTSCSSTGGSASGGASPTTSSSGALSGNAARTPAAITSAPEQPAHSADTALVPHIALGTPEAVSMPLSSAPWTPAITPLQDPALPAAATGQTSGGAHAAGGRLAETGVSGLLTMGVAGASSLVSGGALAAFTAKPKTDGACL